MRQYHAVIDRKRYDTETATLLGEDSYLYPSDFHWWEEALYITKKGVYFLAGQGGALSSYAESVGQNSWGSGSDLRPISKNEALAWAEKHMATSDILTHFGVDIEEA